MDKYSFFCQSENGDIINVTEKEVSDAFTKEWDREEAINLMYSLKCGKKIQTSKDSFWAEEI